MKRHPFILPFLGFVLILGLSTACQTVQRTSVTSDDPLIRAFSQLTCASVSDAVDRVTGNRGFMSHDIRPLFPTKMCGYAVTVLAEPSTKSEPPAMALELVDTEPPGRVLVIVMDGPDGPDVAAFGGIMCTGSVARGFAGAVLDGGCRDVLEIEAMGFPVYTRGIVPSNSLGRYVNIAKNEPVLCGGVRVSPGDILVGDSDGVVVVPRDEAEDVLRVAEELEAKEAVTMKAVKRLKSIREAARQHDRI